METEVKPVFISCLLYLSYVENSIQTLWLHLPSVSYCSYRGDCIGEKAHKHIYEHINLHYKMYQTHRSSEVKTNFCKCLNKRFGVFIYSLVL